MKLEEIRSSNFDNMSVLSAENSHLNCGLHKLLKLHLALCDVLDIINSTYSLQVLASVGWKFINVTIALYLIFVAILDTTIIQAHSIPSLILSISFEATQLVIVVYCCKSVTSQVSAI
jgi:hypothetical protein